MNHTVYLKLSQITELTHKDVVLKDVAQVYCDDQNVMNKCNSMKVMTVKVDAKRRYIMSALDAVSYTHLSSIFFIPLLLIPCLHIL